MDEYIKILRRVPMFSGIADEEIGTILHCVEGKVSSFEKDEFILREGDPTDSMGVVLSGLVLIIQEDYWGHRNILGKCTAGEYFGETFAATPGSILNVSVVAAEHTDVMMMNLKKMLTTCSSACDHHNKLVRNLIGIMAGKVLSLNEKITHSSKRTTREKLLSYLSAEALRRKSSSFDISFDRQQLADYLGVERAAMSAELSKLQREGIIKTIRSHFEILGEL